LIKSSRGLQILSGRGALQGQVAIVTGAGRGIGHAVAMALAREEATVVLAARTRQQAGGDRGGHPRERGQRPRHPMDVTQDAAVEAMVEQAIADARPVDVLVTAAGAASFGPVVGTKPADWDPILAVNLRAVMSAAAPWLPIMVRQRRGTIINVASIAAQRAIPGAAVYTATKAGVVGFSRVLAEEASLGWGTGGCWCREPSIRRSGTPSPTRRTAADAPTRGRGARRRPDGGAPPGASLEELTLLRRAASSDPPGGRPVIR